jgi:hypothetical protein
MEDCLVKIKFLYHKIFIFEVQIRNAYKILFGGPEGKRSLGRPRRRCEDHTEMDLKEI